MEFNLVEPSQNEIIDGRIDFNIKKTSKKVTQNVWIEKINIFMAKGRKEYHLSIQLYMRFIAAEQTQFITLHVVCVDVDEDDVFCLKIKLLHENELKPYRILCLRQCFFFIF